MPDYSIHRTASASGDFIRYTKLNVEFKRNKEKRVAFGWSFRKNKFYKERAQNLVKTANIFATTSIETVTRTVPLINSYFKTYVKGSNLYGLLTK